MEPALSRTACPVLIARPATAFRQWDEGLGVPSGESQIALQAVDWRLRSRKRRPPPAANARSRVILASIEKRAGAERERNSYVQRQALYLQ